MDIQIAKHNLSVETVRDALAHKAAVATLTLIVPDGTPDGSAHYATAVLSPTLMAAMRFVCASMGSENLPDLYLFAASPGIDIMAKEVAQEALRSHRLNWQETVRQKLP